MLDISDALGMIAPPVGAQGRTLAANGRCVIGKQLKKDENLRKLPPRRTAEPAMGGTSPQVVRFESYVLDLVGRSLARDDKLLALRPQALEVLCHLVRHAGRTVSKAELFAAVWPGISVTDDSLVQCIRDIRRVLRDRHRRIVKTVPRLGYLLAAAVSHGEGDEAEAFAGSQTTHSALIGPFADRPLIAVIDLSDLGEEGQRSGLADGITEELITTLSHIRWLSVVRHGAAFGSAARSPRELAARYVLQGSVRLAGERVRINAHLFNSVTGICLWSERYDGRLRERLTLQEEIAGRIAAAIEIQILAGQGAHALIYPADVLGPWNIVARASALFARVTKADARMAIGLLEALVKAQPDYASARSLLGFCLVNTAHMGWISRGEGVSPAREHAVRALELDEDDPWAHTALGYWAMMERRTEESIAAFRRAVELNPHSAASHSHLSRGLAFAGCHGEAIEHGEQAARLGPLDPQKALFFGGIAVAKHAAGRFDEAAHWSIEAQRLRPSFAGSRRMLCASLALSGRTKEARSLLRTLRRDEPQLSMDWLTANLPYQTATLRERYQDGMWKAGLR
jgi:TolB-like protein/Tfp pilus assembly protein PilF